jgi:Rrf2 family protein
MKINTRTRYGVRTMIEIAKCAPEGGVFQKDIAAAQSLSIKYLDHIIQDLKTARLISTVRGKKSGYILMRKPEDITVFDIHRAFEPGISIVDCTSENYVCDRREECRSYGFWSQLNKIVTDYFKSVTLDDLVQGRVKP